MTDLGATIAPKSNQLNADDLTAGPRTITITKVSANEGSAEQPINIYFEGDDNRPYLPCKTVRRVLVSVWGRDGASYVGRAMTLYRDPEVTWGGMKVGGIRVSHMSHIERDITMPVTASKTTRKLYTIKPLRAKPDRATHHVTADETKDTCLPYKQSNGKTIYLEPPMIVERFKAAAKNLGAAEMTVLVADNAATIDALPSELKAQVEALL